MVVQQHRSGGGARAVCALAAMGVMAAAAGCSGGGGDRAAADDRAGPGAVEAVRQAAAVLTGTDADGASPAPVTGKPGATRGAGDPPAQTGAGAGAATKPGVATKSGTTAKVSTSMETAAGGTRVTIRGRGTYDFRSRSGRLEVVLPQDAVGKEEHLPITELLAPGALYMMNRGAGVPKDKWVRIDTTTLADGNLVTGGATDPMAAAELLLGARAVTYLGESDLAGVTVRHYRGTTDIGRAARQAPAASRGALTAAAKGFRTDTVPFDAYLDEQGRLRKVRHRFSFANEGPAVEVVSTTLLYGFGVPVSVRIPAGRDIYTGEIRQGQQP
ncbi:hypothetical protein [Streptomyces sp. ITFR-6]|uniref:hypothetical protein n=1 Tax=Streptomyces sp. ITFR-6 TaxID=3075197 RepID=UPI00288B9897|nr:hypothetical protein [Streptomyces sp. ITFR-6]WNI30290.1 hypothetical protein RLT59_16910 [Streptomyces sp. ITFR-6]